MTQAFAVGRAIEADLQSGRVDVTQTKPGCSSISSLLSRRGVPVVSWSHWLQIDRVEQERGRKVGKPREKIVNVEEMLRVSVGSGGR